MQFLTNEYFINGKNKMDQVKMNTVAFLEVYKLIKVIQSKIILQLKLT